MSLWQVLLIFVLFPFTESDLGPFKILKEWPKPVYDTKCLKNPDKVYYRSTKNQISGIKIFRNKVYLSIPREENGVPVTLGRVPLYAGYKSAPIEPFPSWEFQKDDDNCSHFSSVAGFEIDASGKMWVIDQGKMDKCPSKLVIFNLETIDFVQTGEKKSPDCEVRVKPFKVFSFPEEVSSPKQGSRLGEIVVDEDGPRAYIADYGTENSGILVYNFRTNGCRKFRIQEGSKENPRNSKGAAGLALSPPDRNRTLYYSPRGNLDLYSVPVEILKNVNSTDRQVLDSLTKIGNISSETDGMIADSSGNIYFGLEKERSVVKWNPKAGNLETQKKVLASDGNFTWIDSFAFDLTGNLYFTVNPGPDSRETVSKIYYGRIGFVRSYLYKSIVPFN